VSASILGTSLPPVDPAVFNTLISTDVAAPQKPLDAHTSFFTTAVAAASPYIHSWLMHNGFIKYSPTVPIAQNINNRRVQLEVLKALYSGVDKPAFERIADAVLHIVGLPPEKVPAAAKLKMVLSNNKILAPVIYFLLGDKKYDQLFGRIGSTMLLAKSIIALYAPYGVDGNTAETLAVGVQAYLMKNPHLRKGFTTDDIAKMLDIGVKHGLFYPTIRGEDFIRQASNVISLFAAARDKALREGKTKVEVNELVPEVVQLYQSGSGVPFPEMLRRYRVNDIIRRIAPYGVFQAGVQLSGEEKPISPAVYTEDDIRLRQNAIDSPVGNMVGATVRAVEQMNVGGPLKKFYNQIIRDGKVPVVGLYQWMTMAVRSGLSPPQAFRLLLQQSANKAVLTPEIVQAIRASQLNFDVLPVMDAIMTMEKNPELRKGAIAELASRLGYKNVGMMDAGSYMMFLHSPLIHNKIKRVFDVANRLAAVEEQTSGLAQVPPMARVTEVLMNREEFAKEPRRGWQNIFGVLGPEEFQPLTERITDVQRSLVGLPSSQQTFEVSKTDKDLEGFLNPPMPLQAKEKGLSDMLSNSAEEKEVTDERKG